MQLVYNGVGNKMLGIYVANYVMAVKNSDLTQPTDKNKNTYESATTACKFLWLLATTLDLHMECFEILDCGSSCGHLQSKSTF